MSSSKYRDTCPLDCKVYVGDLGSNASRQELEDVFGYYGPLRNVWVARNPPGFAFVEFEDARDAEDSVRAMDGRKICGRTVRVEMSSGQSRNRNRAPPPRRSAMRPDERCYECGDRGHYARDCSRSGRRGGRRRSRSRSRSRSPRARRYSRSRSRSASKSRSRSKTPKRSRSPSRTKNSRSRSRSRDRKDKSNGQINDAD